jgi:hypothetical protein
MNLRAGQIKAEMVCRVPIVPVQAPVHGSAMIRHENMAVEILRTSSRRVESCAEFAAAAPPGLGQVVHRRGRIPEVRSGAPGFGCSEEERA